MFYRKHVFFCINQKPEPKKCCALGRAQHFAEYMKSRLKEMDAFGPDKVRVSTSGCLGRCSVGPSLVVYPEGIWYNYSTEADIDRIIESHLLGDEILEELKLAD